MAPLSFVSALSTLTLVSTTLAHMQMVEPSPLRDPQADRHDEPKDWNILMPLHADGSDFACKGHQWNTPWTPTATYEAGKTYKMELKGGATHGGGSCQLSMSFDRGVTFRVIKSIEGGCPEQKKYSFTVPAELGEVVDSKRATGLFAWTWFNRVGNREMYMNCAVVDIIPPDSSTHDDKHKTSNKINRRDASQTNVAAQAALSPYPKLFVANLKGVNDCVTKETADVIFGSPGADVAFAHGESDSADPSFGKDECTGQGIKSAPRSSSSSSAPPSSSKWSSSGDDGQWHGQDGHWQPQSTSQTGTSSKCNDGQYHKECFGESDDQSQALADVTANKDPSPRMDKEVDAYLNNLYGEKRSNGRATCKTITTDVKRCRKPNRWVKTSMCTWNCTRKGQVAKKPAVRLEPKRIATKLAALEKQMAKLTTIVTKIKMSNKRAARRQEATSEQSNITEIQMDKTTAIERPTFDLFLTYLERLRDKVIECIRYVAAVTPADTDSLPASHKAAGKTRRQLLVPDMSDLLPTFVFYEYVSTISDTITIAIEALLDGIGPLVHDVAKPLLSYDSPTRYNDTSLPLGNYGGDPIQELANALDGLLDELKVVVGEDVKPSMELPPPLDEDQPTFHPVESEGPVPLYSEPSEGKPTNPYYANSTAGIINSTTSTLNSTTTDSVPDQGAQEEYEDAIDDAQQDPNTDAADLFPWLMGPGPVIPPEVHVDWPGPNNPGEGNLEEMPTIVDDLGPDSEEEVLKWFKELEEKYKGEEDEGGLAGGEMAGIGKGNDGVI